MLILAGLSISALTGSGLFGKAQWAVKLTKIREIEEAANLAYMSRQIDEFSKGEAATIAGVISDLKSQGYNIEQRTSGSTTVTGIELNKTNIKINKNSEETLTYTLVYGEGTVRYFAEIDGKYYEMKFDNGVFKINTEETDLEGINNEPKVTAKSNAENIVTAQKTEGKDEIVLNSLNELGETTITIKEENSGTTIVCNVKVMTLIQGITFKQETIEIEKGTNINIKDLITINPTDATEEIIATIVNAEGITEEIAKIISDENGQKIVGVKEGTTSIKITNEDGTIEVTCPVRIKISATGISLNKSLIEINKNSIDNTLKATLNPTDTTEPVVWSTGDSSKVTVVADTSDPTGKTAKISAVGAGTTTVTATCSGRTASCTVTVKIPATNLTISQTSATLETENNPTIQLTATPTPSNTTDQIEWGTSSSAIATVSNTGLVTGLKAGTATITVTCGSQSKTCSITVKEPLFTGVNKTITDPENALPSGDVIIVDKNLSNGIVIKDKNNREWVWIVVPKTEFKTATSSTQYEKIKNDLIKYAEVYRNSPRNNSTDEWTDHWYSGCGIADSGTYTTYYNKMLNSVYTNGGFWIQRYEDETTKITCPNAQIKASGYAPDSTKTSSLLFGIQWDLVCKYLEVYGGLTTAQINSDSSSWGNYSNHNVGARNDSSKRMNIYDFAGNCYEWTLEKTTDSSTPCSSRGGYYSKKGSEFPASYRNRHYTYNAAAYISFRATFY